MLTFRDLKTADLHLQVETTTYAAYTAEPPAMRRLRKQMESLLKKHFNGRAPIEVVDEEIPKKAIAIFNSMCDCAKRTFTGYIPPYLS